MWCNIIPRNVVPLNAVPIWQNQLRCWCQFSNELQLEIFQFFDANIMIKEQYVRLDRIKQFYFEHEILYLPWLKFDDVSNRNVFNDS